jgi:putative FmdB family regulatory protein
MPIYEYKCPKCGEFEVTQRITENALKKCPTCKSKVERLLSRTSFILKGTGWYATDYASKPSGDTAKADAAKSDSTKSDSSSSDSSKSDSSGKADSSSSSSEKSTAAPASTPAPSSKASSDKSAASKAAD